MQLVIMRSYVEVPQSSAGLFELLSSAEGAKVLDDTTNHTDAPLEILHWQDRRALLLSLTCVCVTNSQSASHMRVLLRFPLGQYIPCPLIDRSLPACHVVLLQNDAGLKVLRQQEAHNPCPLHPDLLSFHVRLGKACCREGSRYPWNVQG